MNWPVFSSVLLCGAGVLVGTLGTLAAAFLSPVPVALRRAIACLLGGLLLFAAGISLLSGATRDCDPEPAPTSEGEP